MSETGSFSTGTGGGGSSVSGSENTDARALTAMQAGAEGDNEDLGTSSRGLQEAVFSTIYTLTKNRTIETAPRLAALRVVVEWLQLFLVIFNSKFAWNIAYNSFIWRAFKWVLVRNMVEPKGYPTYISVFYVMSALILTTVAATVWVALVIKGDKAGNAWIRRIISALQWLALIIYSIMWPAVLDYFTYMWDCSWANLAHGEGVYHLGFTEKNCLAMPHLAHMVFAGVMNVIFCATTLLISVGNYDMNPMTRSILASSDAITTFKIMLTKIAVVLLASSLDDFHRAQIVLMLMLIYGSLYFHIVELPFYDPYINMAWTGLMTGLLLVISLLVGLQFTIGKNINVHPNYASNMTMGVLYGIIPAVLLGAAAVRVRMRRIKKLTTHLHKTFEDRKLAATIGSVSAADARDAAPSVVSHMSDLKSVHRFRDVRQVSLLCRAMRKWDEDGVPDKEASDFGEFLLKAAMARMPNHPTLLVMYTNLLVEIHKDGQAARTQLQLAQKGNPALLDHFNIYVAQQLAKLLKRETGDTLDLMSYIEYQRNYRACVRLHKLALVAQHQFWSSLLRDTILCKDVQRSLEVMEAAEARATAMYRRVLERYPSNGKLLKVYGRFLEYVRNDPWTASKYYDEAMKLGTTESLLSMTQGQSGQDGLALAGNINEKVDGLVIINAQGVVMMINQAALVLFGYEKGELEGKNVNILMPQPYSTHHNTFLQRYLNTGQPHILNKSRQMVALHKDRTMFPVSLFATRLSGTGSDTLFMAVVRRPASLGAENGVAVRFWATSNGTVLCADSSVVDSFGYKASELVGRSFATLCTGNLEQISRFIINFAEQQSELSAAGLRAQDRIQAQVLHAYLPPVDVDLTLELAGAVDTSSDCRGILLQARLLTDPGAVMVLDRKGHLVYVTEKLGAMLGYPVQSLVKMELNTLLPQPYCQMHGAWLKDLTKKNNPTSCRAGAVVHLMAANGTKVPVTLKMLQKDAHDSAGGLLHVVYVTKATEDQRLDQTRLLLNLNHKGTVLEVNPGAPKSLFGFTVTELIGRPLACIIDAFGVWRHEFGEDDSLLMMLSLQALKEGTTGMAGAGKSDSGIHASGASWRVGVHQPVKDEDIAAHAMQLADDRKQNKGGFGQGGTSSLLHALQQQRRLHAACMSFEVMERDDRELTNDPAVVDTLPVFQVSLYRSDSVTATVELDKNMRITRMDGAIGLMLGVSVRTLAKKNFPRLIGLPTNTSFIELLGTKAPVVKKGAMRRSAGGGPPAAGTSRMGVSRTVTAKHLGDGKDLHLEFQAMSYEANGKTRYMVRLQLREASSASIDALLQLRKEGHATEAVAAARAALQEEETSGGGQGLVAVSDGEEEAPEERHQAHNHHAAADGPVSFNRTSDWVRETSSMGGERSPPGSPPRRGQGRERSPVSSPDRRVRKASNMGLLNSQEGYDSSYDPMDSTAVVQIKPRGAAVRKDALLDDADENKVMDNLSKQGAGSAAGSSAQGSSVNDGGSEPGGQSVVSGTGTGHDEELAVDTRRAKRLKKLSRMLHSSLAQVDANLWRLHTLGVLAIILVAHVVCFVVLTTQIDRRYKNANNVAMMTRGLARMQLITLRANFIQKCKNPFFKGMFACSAGNQQSYRSKLQVNCDLANEAHRTLYLGASGIKPFVDKRLLDYWTFKELPEHLFYPTYMGPDGKTHTNVVLESNRTLWEMGNVLVSAGRDLYFQSDKLGMEMNITPIWQYVFQNGPDSIFNGYAWSLDTYVDYAWRDLLSLAVLLIILLVVEALVVQMSCMAYEFRLVQKCNISHMRLFSVFLALPSATVRIMTQRQLQVDDDTKDEMDEDEFELGDAAVVAAAGATNEAGDKAHNKSVRMELGDEHDDEGAGKPSKGRKDGKGGVDGKLGKQAKHDDASDAASDDDNGSPTQSSRKGASTNKSSSKKQPLTQFQAFRRLAYKRVLGWLDPRFKLNGKKLIANSTVVWKFMVPLLLWVCAVIVIFATSYRNLQGLQGPLASLDTVSHVLYRATRCRLFSCMMAFSVDPSEDARWRNALKQEVKDLRTEYNTLLYGGPMMLQANVTFKPVAPASSFADSKITNLFFRTTACLRVDQSGCYNDPSDPFYQITHTGLDAQITRYIDEMTRFSSLPINESFANATSYEYAVKVTAFDTYDGLNTAGDLFVDWTISRFASVKQLHIILLVISLALMIIFVLVLYRPYIKRLKRDSKMVAGMLSQLPAEVDVEGQVRQVVLGMIKGDGGRSANNSLVLGGPPGFMPPGGMPPGGGSMFSSVPGTGSALMVPPGPNMGGSMPGYMPGMQNGGEAWYGRGGGPRWSAGGYDSAERVDRGGYGRGPPQGRSSVGYNKNVARGEYDHDDEV